MDLGKGFGKLDFVRICRLIQRAVKCGVPVFIINMQVAMLNLIVVSH